MKGQEGKEREEVNKFIQQEFGIKDAVELARGMGKEKGEMIWARFKNGTDKEQIMRQRKQIKRKRDIYR